MASLGDRMKKYESIYSYKVTPRTYFAIRLDGKNFSKYTKKLQKPFDEDFSYAMNETAIALCKELNAKFAYTQSDEITLVFAEPNPESESLFDGKIQKLCSISAAIATARFNEIRNQQYIISLKEELGNSFSADWEMDFPKQAYFDSRVFVLPTRAEVFNCVLWRQQDATKNSISMAAQEVYSHKQLKGKNGSEKQEMLFQKGINWNDYPVKFKRGVIVKKVEVEVPTAYTGSGDYNNTATLEPTIRKRWSVDYNTPIFTEDKDYLYDLIPIIE